MLTRTPAIVLSTIKYGEADLIARLYTKELGTQSYMLKGVRKSRKGKLRVSYFQPLVQLEIVTHHKGKGSLEYIKEAQVTPAYDTIHTDIVKSSVVMFFSEILTQLLTEQQPDSELYEYLSSIFQFLDQIDAVANFSIKTLIDLTSYMGFQPDLETVDLPYFNLLDGTFDTNGLLPHHATIEESVLIKQFLGTNFAAIHQIKMNREERNSLLNLVIDYFQIHLHVFKKPTSLTILKQLFDT
ncbi:DNA repair protein RecO [Nonlabens mediterrranea]|uniref:DNA repair protein RecO n=1 Tax=Nonlabens mediterrranea TaxID=1419947 RepID=A0ABS0A0G2_9FLAO|nr:putative DNA repair protein, RecO [Flavobacteria bacterium BBFL7]MBF4982852.1 DNA repair protein RecO [Nonlabens mediterrranea]